MPFIVGVGAIPFGCFSACSLPNGGLPATLRVGRLKDKGDCACAGVSMLSAAKEGIIQGLAASRSKTAEQALHWRAEGRSKQLQSVQGGFEGAWAGEADSDAELRAG